MSWSRSLEIVVVVNRGRGSPLAVSVTNSTQVERLELISHDTFPLQIRFVQLTGTSTNPLVPVRLAAGSEIVFAGKLLSNLAANDLLFRVVDFIEYTEGDEEDPRYFYEATLNTNTEQVSDEIDALTGNNRVLQCLADLEIQTVDNSQRTTFQMPVNIKRHVYAGNEGDPSDANPAWPQPDQIVLKTHIGTPEGPAAQTALEGHAADTENPHAVTKAQVGLSNVPNVDATDRANHTGAQTAATISDFDEAAAAAAPVSSVAGRTGNVALTKVDVGLDEIDNTADLDKPISNATQAALNSKAALPAHAPLSGSEIDLGSDGFYWAAFDENATMSIANPANGKTVVVEITTADGAEIEWPSGIIWPGGSAPAHPVNGKALYCLFRLNGSTKGFIST